MMQMPMQGMPQMMPGMQPGTQGMPGMQPGQQNMFFMPQQMMMPQVQGQTATSGQAQTQAQAQQNMMQMMQPMMNFQGGMGGQMPMMMPMMMPNGQTFMMPSQGMMPPVSPSGSQISGEVSSQQSGHLQQQPQMVYCMVPMYMPQHASMTNAPAPTQQ
jgi:hypothetical protein